MTGIGAFASEVVATPPRNDQVFRIPDAMGWDEAAAFDLTYGTAIQGLSRRGKLEAGESVLVLGAAGGTGSAAIQVAKAMGAYVIGAAGGAEKLAIAEQCGADAVVDYREEGLSARVKELTGGAGVDVVFDPVGGGDFREYLRCLAWNGRYLVVGFAAGDIPSIGLNLILLKSVSIVGVAYGASAPRRPGRERQRLRAALPLVRRRVVEAGDRSPLPARAGSRGAARRHQPRHAGQGHHRHRRLTDSTAGQRPAVDGVELAGDPRPLVRAEEHDHPRDVVAAPGAPERDHAARSCCPSASPRPTSSMRNVSMIPGHTAFTRIPSGPSSCAIAHVNAWIAAFDAE